MYHTSPTLWFPRASVPVGWANSAKSRSNPAPLSRLAGQALIWGMKGKGSKPSGEEHNSSIQLDASLLSPQRGGADQGAISKRGVGVQYHKRRTSRVLRLYSMCVCVCVCVLMWEGVWLKSDVTLCEPKHRSVTAVIVA